MPSAEQRVLEISAHCFRTVTRIMPEFPVCAFWRKWRGSCMSADFPWVNVDATLVAQAPKIKSYKVAMAERLSGALGVNAEQVNVKATTEEGLGFTGDGTGMAAHAVALLEKQE